MSDQIWYAAYGSNLDPDRFECYLSGGRPLGATRTYPGVREPVLNLQARALRISGQLSFAWHSPTWGGGIAFYEPAPTTATPAGHPEKIVLARGYLLTHQALSDVVEQEMRRSPSVNHDFAEVVRTGRQMLGPGRYETLHRVGEFEGRAVLTFGIDDAASLGLRAPAAAYVATIARGLRRTHDLTLTAVVDYLLDCPGMTPGWDRESLTAVVSDSR